MQAPSHLGHLGERAVRSQVPLWGQLTALGAGIRALRLAPTAPDALAAEVVTAVGHHRVREVVEADGAGGLLLEVGGQVGGGHSAVEMRIAAFSAGPGAGLPLQEVWGARGDQGLREAGGAGALGM